VESGQLVIRLPALRPLVTSDCLDHLRDSLQKIEQSYDERSDTRDRGASKVALRLLLSMDNTAHFPDLSSRKHQISISGTLFSISYGPSPRRPLPRAFLLRSMARQSSTPPPRCKARSRQGDSWKTRSSVRSIIVHTGTWTDCRQTLRGRKRKSFTSGQRFGFDSNNNYDADFSCCDYD
jgi:hypothetical protein